ncbi:MAG TPA: polysaccharide biosynthesis/export family protein [Candidatus Binataceae bacterium]|nr:polysaccharide biosynthesis/export family protein [Candidatus Binataceae bacterium]
METQTIPTPAHERPKPYVIGSDDEVEIIVWQQPQLSGKVIVAPDGTITMPLIDRVQAAGRTPDQLKDKLQELYARYVHDPSVTVRVSEPRSQVFYVTGAVNKPGAYKLRSGEVLSQAISEAGGFGDYADPGKIRIMRHGEAETVVLTVNYNRITSDASADVSIEPGDTITVP